MCTTSGNQTPNGSTKQKAQTQGAPLPAVRSCRRRRPARAQTAPPEPERNTKQKSRKTEPGSRYGAATRDSGAAMRTSTLTTRDRDGAMAVPTKPAAETDRCSPALTGEARSCSRRYALSADCKKENTQNHTPRMSASDHSNESRSAACTVNARANMRWAQEAITHEARERSRERDMRHQAVRTHARQIADTPS